MNLQGTPQQTIQGCPEGNSHGASRNIHKGIQKPMETVFQSKRKQCTYRHMLWFCASTEAIALRISNIQHQFQQQILNHSFLAEITSIQDCFAPLRGLPESKTRGISFSFTLPFNASLLGFPNPPCTVESLNLSSLRVIRITDLIIPRVRGSLLRPKP